MSRQDRVGWAFVAPATLHLAVFALFPLGFSLYLSAFKWNLVTNERRPVGFGNFAYALGDPLFWNALGNSAIYALLSVPLGMAAGLGVALLVNQRLRGVNLFRTLYYIPAISSGVAIAMLWTYMYLPQSGLINTVLGWFGIDDRTDFLNNPATAMLALVFMSIWVGLGPRMVLYLAGLLAIPPSLYEAAELDGAGPLRRLANVTLPMLAPTTLFVLVTSTIGALQVFTPVYMMTNGGPGEATDVVGFHIYNEAWSKFLVGVASAKSVLVLIVIALASVIQFRLMRRQMEGYSAT